MKGKRVLSFLIAVVMLLSASCVSAFAQDSFSDGDFSYVLNNGGAKIISCVSEQSVLTVPEKLGEYAVVGVAQEAFKESAATVVNLPQSLLSVDRNAFKDCAVTDLYVPAACTSIAAEAIDAGIHLYSVSGSAAQSYANENGNAFTAVAFDSVFKSYVGKSQTLSVPEGAVPESVSGKLSFKGATFTAVEEGEDSVRIVLPNGIAALVKFEIAAAPASIIGLPKQVSLYVGESYTSWKPAISNGKYDGKFSYSVANKSIASVDASTGKVTALKVGTTTIKVSFEKLLTSTVTLKVGNAPKDFSLNTHDLLIGVKEPAALTYRLGDNQFFKSITFTSSNTKVATINAKGVITANKVGTTTLTAVLDNGKKDSCILTVGKAPTVVYLNKTSANVGVGEKVTFKATVNNGAVCSTYLWRSTDKSVFTVDENGTISAKKAGTAKLRVYTYNYQSKRPYIYTTCVINVKKAPSSVSFNKTNLVLGLGESYDLNTVLPKNTASYKRTLKMEDLSVAKNAAGMVITGLKLGKTTFTLTTFNGKKAVCNITVKPAPERVACKPTSVKLAIKQNYQLSPYVNKGSVCSSYIYKSSNKKVCTVDANGVVHVKDYGECFVNIYTYNHTKKNPITCKVKLKVGYITNKIASFTTYFDKYYYGKSVNLKVASKYINGKTDGYILQPGKVFSFNAVVGARTKARGFVDGKVISGEGYVDGIGGGICQAATTIFNSALLCNCAIVERHCHSLKSSYVAIGRDAAISWGSQDFKFKNTYNTPIRIKMNYNSNGSINCSIYSLKKVKVPKIAIKVSKVKGGYKTVRKAGGKVNYTTYSYYNN